MTPADQPSASDATPSPEPQKPVPDEPRQTSPAEPRQTSSVGPPETSRLWARGNSTGEPLEVSAEWAGAGQEGGSREDAGGRPRGRRAALVALVLVIAAAAGVGLGVAIALPGWLPGPPAAPGPAQPSYVIDTQASPSATRRAAAPAVPSPIPAEYTVEPGDTLRSIAEKLYGDANLWPTLYDANRDTIGPDPDALRVGMGLRLPAR